MGTEAAIERRVVRAHSHAQHLGDGIHARLQIIAKVFGLFDEVSEIANDLERNSGGSLRFVEEELEASRRGSRLEGLRLC